MLRASSRILANRFGSTVSWSIKANGSAQIIMENGPYNTMDQPMLDDLTNSVC